ncbi:hypothetical protein HMPREF1983_01014 [Gemella bergeri ATCC 700627]|uniref:Peptidase M20 dimerisation domain-containing protein n=1 Tax=Gemella bergeri ATCC 700627 TaxID=1321820 RepID=U2QNA2_9BACL|nr:peptidase dimerization domain-containing protein [Gemella bergeri]ERK57689.1 hypothetical protein HMPREF1983_01014 [Gemella bergeri ATCC 700627]
MNKWKLTIIGKGGHGAEPHNTIDATVIVSEFVRKISKYPEIDILSISSGNAFNVISEKAEVIIQTSSKDIIERIISSLLLYYGDKTSYKLIKW